MIRVVQPRAVNPLRRERDTEAQRDLLEPRRGQSQLAAGGSHALHSAPPLFDQTERVKHSADDPVAKPRNPAGQVFNCEAEREKARVLDFEPVLEDRQADRRTALRVVGVRHRVDQHRIATASTIRLLSVPTNRPA